jgi:hypothetical protein
MLIEITKEQLKAIERLCTIGDYYLENMGVDNEMYESDMEDITEGQEAVKHIEKQFIEASK